MTGAGLVAPSPCARRLSPNLSVDRLRLRRSLVKLVTIRDSLTAVTGQMDDKLAFDSHLMDVYLTGLQSEVEAKLRRVLKFREQMQKIDAAGGRTNREQRELAAESLVKQIEEMLDTNLLVRETLQELLMTARAVLQDVKDLAD